MQQSSGYIDRRVHVPSLVVVHVVYARCRKRVKTCTEATIASSCQSRVTLTQSTESREYYNQHLDSQLYRSVAVRAAFGNISAESGGMSPSRCQHSCPNAAVCMCFRLSAHSGGFRLCITRCRFYPDASHAETKCDMLGQADPMLSSLVVDFRPLRRSDARPVLPFLAVATSISKLCIPTRLHSGSTPAAPSQVPRCT